MAIGGDLQPQMGMQQQQGDAQQIQGAPQAQPGHPPQGPNPSADQAQPDPSMGSYGADQQTDPDQQQKNFLDYAFQEANLAKKLKGKKDKDGKLVLDEMASVVLQGYIDDEVSRDEWLKSNTEWIKLATLIRENKVWPWPKASNIIYPLLATAAMQFSARAYPALVPTDGKIVKTKILQKDPQDPVYQAAERIGQHMSYQLLERIPDWEEDMDKLLMTMAISGLCFKKTYYDSASNYICSHLVYPENLCINYWATSLDKAYRITELLYYTDNDLREKVQNEQYFLDEDFPSPTSITEQDQKKKPLVSGAVPPPPGKSTPHTILSCHTFWDLDGDGYEEPYIITVHKEMKKVLRVSARWTMDKVYRDDEGKVKMIQPLQYFTDFPFIPNPDGSMYALGFGRLLGPLNQSSNTLINQLIDAGTLANMPSGFIGKGLRLRIGQTALSPGEFKVVNATGEDLQKSIYHMQVPEPSTVLFQLLNMLIDSGNKLASIAEIFVGKMPGQNTPATTTQESIQQGMAVFTAIYKRVYRSLTKEFRKIYFFNKICPDIIEEESKLSGMPLQQSDYNLPEWTIVPAADPTGDTNAMRMQKLQQLGQLLQMGTLDPMWYTKQVIDASDVPNGQQGMRQPSPPPPDPKLQTEQMKQQGMQQKFQNDSALANQKMSLEQQKAEMEHQREQQRLAHEQSMALLEQQNKQMELRHKAMSDAMDRHSKMINDHMDAMGNHAMLQQKLRHNEAIGQQKVKLAGQQKHQQSKSE